VDQSKRPPIPTSSSYSFGGSGAFGASFLASFFSYFFSSFFSSLTGADEAARASSSGILNPDSIERAAMFLKPLAMMSGTVASIGYPAAKERPAMFLTPS